MLNQRIKQRLDILSTGCWLGGSITSITIDCCISLSEFFIIPVFTFFPISKSTSLFILMYTYLCTHQDVSWFYPGLFSSQEVRLHPWRALRISSETGGHDGHLCVTSARRPRSPGSGRGGAMRPYHVYPVLTMAHTRFLGEKLSRSEGRSKSQVGWLVGELVITVIPSADHNNPWFSTTFH